jgi:hypothetical protein
MILGPNGTLAMGFGFNVSDLVSGALFESDATVAGLEGAALEITGSALATHNTGTLAVGELRVDSAAYELTGDSTLAVARDEYVGYSGAGDFFQVGGTHTVGGSLYVGYEVEGSGLCYMGGGALSVAGDEHVGHSGAGQFLQDDGSHAVTGALNLGTLSGSSGTLELLGGAVTADRLVVGSAGAGTLALGGGSASLVTVGSAMELGPGGRIAATAGSTIELTGAWGNNSTDGAAFGPFGLEMGSRFNVAAHGPHGIASYEVGGGDYGPIGPGYYENFALGDFQVTSRTTTLVDLVANDPEADGTANALYVDTLRIADGATLVLNGHNVYYHNWDGSAGWGGALVNSGAALWAPGPGDFDGNAAVGLGDFSLFAGEYGLTEGEIGWDRRYDLDRNGAIGLGDFSLFAGLYGTVYTYGGPGAPVTSAPEPVTVALVALSGLALVRPRRWRAQRVGMPGRDR